MSTPPLSVPPVLARFPAEVQAAYLRFLQRNGQADLQVLVQAALRDFMPRRQNLKTPHALEGSQKLIEDLGLDSLAVAEMVFFFEDLFQVSIPSQEILSLHTVADLEEYVIRKYREKSPPA